MRDFWSIVVLVLLTSTFPFTLAAQQLDYDASWFRPGHTYAKIAIVADDVYAVSGSDLSAAGFPISTAQPHALRLYYKGQEIPIRIEGGDDGQFDPADRIVFAGTRNDPLDEHWAYNYIPENQSSPFSSLYTDTTHYWLTIDSNGTGLRYQDSPMVPQGEVVNSFSAQTYWEEDTRYYFGAPSDNGFSIYSRGEGFRWQRIAHSNANPVTLDHTLELAQPSRSLSDSAHVSLRIVPESAATHKVIFEVELNTDSGLTYFPTDTLTWTGYTPRDLTYSFSQNLLPADNQIRIRITSFNDINNTIVNVVALDWIEVTYKKQFVAGSSALPIQFEAPNTYTIPTDELPTGALLLNPTSAIQKVLSFPTDTFIYPNTNQTLWIANPAQYAQPSSITSLTAPNIASTSNAADYVIVTTPMLRASAEQHAAYRTTTVGGGYTVRIIEIQDIFDTFDYGRPTPIALRRFVRASQAWQTPPKHLLLWGDALYPDPNRVRHPWEVLSFGNAASDSWFAMQNNGTNDWTESISIGRVTMRANEQGFTFVDKIKTYEAQTPDAWQKRALFLVGGTSPSEKLTLQNQALQWSNITATSAASLDTLHVFKTSNEALDPTFKDSLNTALSRGASWLSYFGHSASTTWEIVTSPPQEFDNADRLPIALSYGCYTGNFALGSGNANDVITLGEDLVSSSPSGSIAHFGASDTGTIGASSVMGRRVHEAVFRDSLRVLGLALQVAKNRFAQNLNARDFQGIKHALQYGLIGDPATRLNMPTLPDLVVTPARIEITPSAPLPSDSLLTITSTLANFGLTPRDSVDVTLTHTLPTGEVRMYEQRVAPYGLERTVTFSAAIDEGAIGDNMFEIAIDLPLKIEEVSRSNNMASKTHVVFSSGLTLNSPAQQALVSTRTPTLKASFAAPNVAVARAIFELDTSPLFDSADLQRADAPLADLEAAWQPNELTEGITYYWRARPNTADARENWSTGAFTIRTDLRASGWYQQN